MSLHVTATNFRILRDIAFSDDGLLSVLVGLNEAGKSSFAAAIKFAFCGEAYGCKGKEVSKLVSHGADRLSVRVEIGDTLAVQRTTTSGDSLKSIADRLGVHPDLLPLLFDQKVAGDGGSKAMKTYLSGVGQAMFRPEVHFADNAPIKYRIDAALRSGATTAKQILKHCTDMRALQKDPPEPIRPLFAEPTSEVIAAATAAATSAEAELRAAGAKRDDLTATVDSLTAVLNYINARALYDAAVQQAAAVDALPGRQSLVKVVNLNMAAISSYAELMRAAGLTQLCDDFCSIETKLAFEIARIKQLLAANPQPNPPPAPPALPSNATATYEALVSANMANATTVQSLLSSAITALEAAKLAVASTSGESFTATNARDTRQRELGAWQAYKEALPKFQSDVVRIRDEWHAWDAAAKAIEAAEAEFIAAQGAVFGNLVSELTLTLLQGRKLRIDPTEGIFLGTEPIESVSESTRWRMEIAVMAAIAISLRSPILILDGADILDTANRRRFFEFVLQSVVPRFKHTVVLSTCRDEPEKEQPLNIPHATKWLVANGRISKI
jgi:hypothetical protein